MPKTNVGRLRQPGAARAQPWYDTKEKSSGVENVSHQPGL